MIRADLKDFLNCGGGGGDKRRKLKALKYVTAGIYEATINRFISILF